MTPFAGTKFAAASSREGGAKGICFQHFLLDKTGLLWQ